MTVMLGVKEFFVRNTKRKGKIKNERKGISAGKCVDLHVKRLVFF